MTYKEIIQTPGRRIRKHVYYYDSSNELINIDDSNIKSVKLKFNAPLLGTIIKSCDLVLKEKIETNARIYVDVDASYEEETATTTYGPYYLRQEATYNADEKTYTHECYNEMLLTMVDYDLYDENGEIIPRLNVTFPCSISDYFNALVQNLGLENNVSSLANGSRIMNSDIYTGINYTCRDVLEDIAIANGTLFNIEDNQISIYELGTGTSTTINDDILKNTNIDFGEHFGAINTLVLSRAGGGDNVYYPSPLPQDPYEFKISDNQLMNNNDRSDYMPAIFNKVSNIEYDVFDTELVGWGGFTPLEKVTFQTGDNYYNSYIFNWEVELEDGYKETIYTEYPEETVTDYSKADETDKRINQTYFIVDKQNQTIQSVVTNVTEQNEKISQITQTVDEINSKIQDIADITVSAESSYAFVELLNVNESEPIILKVRPIGENISFLYPRSNLYPSNNLFSTTRKIRFHNVTDDTNVDYELPEDLLYYNATTYDEFSLGYDTQTCVVTKRCSYDAQGNVVPLAQEETHIITPYPVINLTDGDYEVSILGHNAGYISVTLMAKNIYTTQFYTKAETNSQIQQTASSINLSVDQKLSNYSTTQQMNSAISITAAGINTEVAKKVGNDEVISKINQSAEQISISASKVNLNGYITATDLAGTGTTVINGANIQTGTLSANTISGGTINASNINVTNLTASNITRGSINGIPYGYSSSYGGRVSLGNNSDGPIMGYRGDSPRWSLASFTAGGRFQTFDENGNIAAYFNQTGAHNSSDIRYKQNVSSIDSKKSMNVINNLTPIEYQYKDCKEYHRGLSAQEVEEVLKNNGIENQVYEINEQGRYSLNYVELIPDLINCIKYLQNEIEELKTINEKESDK